MRLLNAKIREDGHHPAEEDGPYHSAAYTSYVLSLQFKETGEIWWAHTVNSFDEAMMLHNQLTKQRNLEDEI